MPAPSYPRSGRHPWSPSVVHHILSDPIYAGTAYANRYTCVPARKPGASRAAQPTHRRGDCRQLKPREQWIAIPVPAMIDAEIWDRAQAQLARNAALSFRNNSKHNYLLRCLLTCEACGLAMFGRTTRPTARQPERQLLHVPRQGLHPDAPATALPEPQSSRPRNSRPPSGSTSPACSPTRATAGAVRAPRCHGGGRNCHATVLPSSSSDHASGPRSPVPTSACSMPTRPRRSAWPS